MYGGAVPEDDPVLDDLISQAEDRLAEAEAELRRLRLQVGVAESRFESASAELRKLEEVARSLEDRSDDGMAYGSRTDAIVDILRRSRRQMSINELVDELNGAGVVSEYASVASTLQHLVNDGRVQRPARGRYTAR